MNIEGFVVMRKKWHSILEYRRLHEVDQKQFDQQCSRSLLESHTFHKRLGPINYFLKQLSKTMQNLFPQLSNQVQH